MKQTIIQFEPVETSSQSVTQTRRWSIRTQLILAVNVPLALALAVLLALDYRREMSDAVAEKRASLDREAMIIGHAVAAVAKKGQAEALQRYIDTVCARMQQSQSLGHHIWLRWHGNTLQSQMHVLDTQTVDHALPQAIESVDCLAAANNELTVAGRFTSNDADVYVFEHTTSIRSSIEQHIISHLTLLAVLAFAAGAIVNLVLWRMVARPLRKLSSAVARVAKGEYGTHINGFNSRELNELSGEIQKMSHALASNERERNAEMDLARRIQEHLLPSGIEVPGLAVARLFAPADAVAGDYYDLIRLADDTWLICVADISGHGVPAAMGSAMLKTLLLSAVEHQSELGQILQYINRRLAIFLPSGFASMFLGRWNSRTFRMEYASAGHEPGLQVSQNGTSRELHATGLLLGIDDNAVWETANIELPPGERLLLTTDGVAETNGTNHELFGRQHLADVVLGCAGLSPDETVHSIRTALLEHQAGKRATDDVTILLLESVKLSQKDRCELNSI
jgi:serine phosphatase RsbU (regulator of sigma subunit)/predicted metal-binding protein